MDSIDPKESNWAVVHWGDPFQPRQPGTRVMREDSGGPSPHIRIEMSPATPELITVGESSKSEATVYSD